MFMDQGTLFDLNCVRVRLNNTLLNTRVHELRTVDPRHGDSFEQHGNEHRVSGSVTIEQIEKVKSSLGA